jgi:hypothetical protein
LIVISIIKKVATVYIHDKLWRYLMVVKK